MNFKFTVPLPAKIKDRLFGDHDPAPAEKTPSAPELAEANKAFEDMNRQIRDQDGRDVKTLKNILER